MSNVFLVVKYLHIVLAIVAVGFNASYGIILGQAKRDAAKLDFALRLIRVLDNKFANPAYALLVFTGLGMLHMGKISIKSHWVLATLGTLAVMIPMAVLYARTTRKQLEALGKEGPEGAEFKRLESRSLVLGLSMFVLVFGILALMVFKPHWG